MPFHMRNVNQKSSGKETHSGANEKRVNQLTVVSSINTQRLYKQEVWHTKRKLIDSWLVYDNQLLLCTLHQLAE